METQKLLLAEDVFDALDNGKLTTIRLGRRDIKLGELVFESVDYKRTVVVDVLCVRYSKLCNVRYTDLQNDGFKDFEDMLDNMKRFYENITLEDEVTTINFSMFNGKK